MIANDLPTLWVEAEEEHVAEEVLVEEEVAVQPQDVAASGTSIVVMAMVKMASSARSTVKEIILLLNVGTCSMSPTSGQKLVAATAATSSYQIDPSWYMDSGATDHITSELENLSVKNKYQGGDQVHIASGICMNISYIGHTTFPTPKHSILLKDILYVPRTKKNLVSIDCLTTNNSIFIELHPTFFLIKDQKTRTTLLRG
jgi:hypothetical protein